MPTINIPTDKYGTLHVPVDQAPTDPAELQKLAEQAVSQYEQMHIEKQGRAALLDPKTPVDEKRGFWRGLLSDVGKAALPTVGGIAGGAAGGLITSPSVAGVPAGVLAGEMIGSGAGEAVNQALGITE